MPTVRDLLLQGAVERNLRRTTVLSYERLLTRLGIIDLEACEVTQQKAVEALWAIETPNTRRAAAVALRAVLRLQIKVPRSIPKRYDLPDEDTLRLALMCSPFEDRLLTMAYAGLRIGEACAIGGNDVDGDRLVVARQVIEEHRTGEPTVVRLAPVKTSEAAITIPLWLAERIVTLDGHVRPGTVRESLRRAGRKVGLHLSPHELRHWYATTLLARGVPLISVSRQMRHSDPQTTLRTYAQADDQAEIHRVLG